MQTLDARITQIAGIVAAALLVAGCFLVLRETVWETIVDYDGGIHELVHTAGHIGSFRRDIIHDVRNEGDRGAVTLHAYRPELTTMTKYEIVNGVVRKLDI